MLKQKMNRCPPPRYAAFTRWLKPCAPLVLAVSGCATDTEPLPVPADWARLGKNIVLLDHNQSEIVRIPEPNLLKRASVGSVSEPVVFLDLTHDGSPEVVTLSGVTDRAADYLNIYDLNGNKLLTRLATEPLSSGSNVPDDMGWKGLIPLTVNGEDKLLAVRRSHYGNTSVVDVIGDASGESARQLWHPGHLEDYLLVEINGKQYPGLGGTHNPSSMATILLLDPNSLLAGASKAPVTVEEGRPLGIAAALRFPKDPWGDLVRSNLQNFEIAQDGKARVTCATRSDINEIVGYRLDLSNMALPAVSGVFFGDVYRQELLDSGVSDAEMEAAAKKLEHNVEILKPEGWVTYEEALKSVPPGARPLRFIEPKGPEDWRVFQIIDVIDPKVTVQTSLRTGSARTWTFTMDAVEGETASQIIYELDFADWGIPPLSREEIEFISWGWRIENMETADRVILNLRTENGIVPLAVSHTIYDYGAMQVFETREQWSQYHTTITEVEDFHNRANKPLRETEGPYVGIQLSIYLPHDQTVHFGNFMFGAARIDPPPPSPRRQPKRLAEGRFVPTDLDNDGVVEILAPWLPGSKVWTYDPADRRFLRAQDMGELTRDAPYYLMVAADLDFDGDRDIVAMEPNMVEIQILENRQRVFSGPRMSLPLPDVSSVATSMAVADDDHDGDLDLFVGYHLGSDPKVPMLYRLEAEGDGTYGRPTGIPAALPPKFSGTYWTGVADVDLDGNPDIVSGAPGPGICVFPGDGRGNYGDLVQMLPLPYSGFLREVILADLDGDDYPDLFYAQGNFSGDSHFDGANHFVRNLGGFQFEDITPQVNLMGQDITRGARLADVDGAPGLEILTLEQSGIFSQTLRHLPKGSNEQSSFPRELGVVDTRENTIIVQDLDGDGTADLVLGNGDSPVVLHSVTEAKVASIYAGGIGKQNSAPGKSLRGEHWNIPLMTNNRRGVVPVVVAAGEKTGLGEQLRTSEPGERRLMTNRLSLGKKTLLAA